MIHQEIKLEAERSNYETAHEFCAETDAETPRRPSVYVALASTEKLDDLASKRSQESKKARDVDRDGDKASKQASQPGMPATSQRRK